MMKRRFLPAAVALLPMVLWTACGDRAQPLAPDAPLGATGGPHVVQVDPPAGNPDDDRAAILAALDQVKPGGTVQFAAGMYVIGFNEPFNTGMIQVTVPGITLVGHPEGTTLNGCDPEELSVTGFPFVGCNGLELSGGHQTVRNLDFENSWFALVLGGLEFRCDNGCFPIPIKNPTTGGYRVEGNTFRSNRTGIRVRGQWSEPAIIRNNTFLNHHHVMSVAGMTAHFVDNDVSAPEPEKVPLTGQSGGAIFIVGFAPADLPRCDHNVVAGNRIRGHPEAIIIDAFFPGDSCRHNVIRANTILNSRIPQNQATILTTGVAMSLHNEMGDGIIEDNLIEGNRIVDSDGLAIEVLNASRNRIVNNTVHGVTLRDPALGMTFRGPFPQLAANGSGIWVSPGSDENQILANTFTDLASDAVVLEGNRNHVATRSAGDLVRDLGTDNRVTGPGSTATATIPAPAEIGSEPAERPGAEPVTAIQADAGGRLEIPGDRASRARR
jgi:parallel beta-helix repeat protein